MPVRPAIGYVENDGVSVAYATLGDGDRDLVFVPGFASHIEVMAEQPGFVHTMERLTSFSRVIGLEKRGTGLSDPVEHTPTLEEWADDVEAVMDATGSDRATIVGASEGGTTALLFAASRPERVSQLILIAAYPRFAAADDYPWGVPPDVWQVFVDGVSAKWGQGVLASNFAPSHADDDEFAAWWARYQRASASPSMIRRLLASYPDMDARHLLPSIQAPTLLLHRRDDALVPVEHARYMADRIPDARLVELDGADHLWFVDGADDFVDEIQEFVTGERRSPEPADRFLATVLFTDIVGSTRQAAELGDERWGQLLSRHDELVRNQLDRFRGREVKTLGDGFMAAFDGPARAIGCATAITEEARSIGLAVRAGLHCGECSQVGEDLQGIAVNIAARIAARSGPDEVLVSSTVKDLVAGADFTFEDRGSHELKGLPDQWRIFRVA